MENKSIVGTDESFNYQPEQFQIPEITLLSNIEGALPLLNTDLFVGKVLCYNLVFNSRLNDWEKMR